MYTTITWPYVYTRIGVDNNRKIIKKTRGVIRDRERNCAGRQPILSIRTATAVRRPCDVRTVLCVSKCGVLPIELEK